LRTTRGWRVEAIGWSGLAGPLHPAFKGLSFIDSSGIGVLIQASRASSNGSRMHVVIGRGSLVERVFRIAGIGQALPVCFDREQAVTALAWSPDGRPDAGA
jgi:hypothetical protein